MKRTIPAGIALFAAALLGVAVPAATAQDVFAPPQPGPEHAVLKAEEGTWDATIEMQTPGGPMTSKGTEVNRMGCGGRCLISDFTGEFAPGMTFEGHGVTVWDAAKRKYVQVWTDSLAQGISMGESTWDEKGKMSAGWLEGPDMTGAVVRMKTQVEHKDPDTRVFTMFGPDGAPGMTITYRRKK